ncbi:ABC transporter permease [Micromonospora sp. DT53]|uniref:ABC transporter permease n=1 Tax=Micromonospora sp. DT53 TaxID=3393444 RepID=UPI003CF832C7
MPSTMLVVGPKLGVALVVLTLVAAAVVTLGKLGHGRQVIVAAVRAAIQLGAVSLLIAATVVSLWATAAFVVLMCVVATVTSGRRITGGSRGWWAGAPIVGGSMLVVAGLLLAGLVPMRGIAVIPVAGILIGGASPLAAGVTQLVVLVGLLAVEAVAVVLTVELVARGRLQPTRSKPRKSRR